MKELAERENFPVVYFKKNRDVKDYPIIEVSGTQSKAQRMAKKRKVMVEDEYQNLNFIFGFAAKVERLFSIASFVLTRSRN